MTKNRGKGRWADNMLRPSDQDTIALCQEVQVRFLELCQDYLRCKNVQLAIPKDYDKDMFLWRTMAVRHRGGDLRHTKDEKSSLQRIADWTLKVKCSLVGKAYEPIEWRD